MAGAGPMTVAPRGTHLLRFDGGETWPASAADFVSWSIAYTDTALARIYGDAPQVVAVEADDDLEGGLLRTDAGMIPDVSYTITPPAYDSGAQHAAVAFTALRPSVTAAPDQAAPLLDIAAPLIRPEGAGGDYRLIAGDREMASGLVIVEKAIWHQLLRDASPLKPKTARPSDIRSEEQRIRRTVEAIPYVASARVLLTFDADDQMTIAIEARTDFGSLETERTVPNG